MTSVNRVDQAVLLLKDRLRQMRERAAGSATPVGQEQSVGRADPLASVRQIAKRRALTDGELKRALVRTFLIDAFGNGLSGSLEFQSIIERVTLLIEEHEVGQELLAVAIAELG